MSMKIPSQMKLTGGVPTRKREGAVASKYSMRAHPSTPCQLGDRADQKASFWACSSKNFRLISFNLTAVSLCHLSMRFLAIDVIFSSLFSLAKFEQCAANLPHGRHLAYVSLGGDRHKSLLRWFGVHFAVSPWHLGIFFTFFGLIKVNLLSEQRNSFPSCLLVSSNQIARLASCDYVAWFRAFSLVVAPTSGVNKPQDGRKHESQEAI